MTRIANGIGNQEENRRMVGITKFGAYVPIYRMSQAELNRAWARGGGKGELAVANVDEDSITMGVNAALDCIDSDNAELIDGVYFATTTSPFREKPGSPIIAMAANMRRDVHGADFGETLRAGTAALRAALDAVKAGTEKQSLVVASDVRMGEPKSEFEQAFGDGAAAVMIGDADVAAELEAVHSHTDELYDVWRMKEDDYVKSWEDRFVALYGVLPNIKEAADAILKKTDLEMKDMAKVVFYAPDARRAKELAKNLKLEESQIQDPMLDSMGNTGCAYGLMSLVAALEEAKPGDRILFLNYSNGCDAFIFKATDSIEKGKGRRGMKGHLASKLPLPSYESYIRFRDMMPVEMARRPQKVSSATALYRDRKWIFGANASKCRKCGFLQFPAQRVCLACRSKDESDYVPIARWTGKMFTFAKDNLALSPDPPTIFCICNMLDPNSDDKCRFYSQMTDRDPNKVEVDMTLEMTFRNMHNGGGYPNYFWKVMPVR
jgi:hydroxymethylglutaryl-CoA synthase